MCELSENKIAAYFDQDLMEVLDHKAHLVIEVSQDSRDHPEQLDPLGPQGVVVQDPVDHRVLQVLLAQLELVDLSEPTSVSLTTVAAINCVLILMTTTTVRAILAIVCSMTRMN